MLASTDSLLENGCKIEKREKLCRSRGGESCAFDGAMIVLQPIADTAHIVHGPIACCGNSWEGRGTLSSNGILHKMGFTTNMDEMDIVYGSEKKLYNAILKVYESVSPKAIFVYATCVSGLMGEDIESVCKVAESSLGIKVIPVNAPGFIGPKNLGNRVAGEVLLNHVIGSGKPSFVTKYDINLIGEYNIAGDLWLVEPVLERAGVTILARITGDSTFKEITYAHKAKLNVVVCSRALINVAKEMEAVYGIPYVEVSFYGKTEIARGLRAVASNFKLTDKVESIIAKEEQIILKKLKKYEHLKGKKALLYSGGVKSWSFISALLDLGIETVAVGTKKSSFEDEEKMKEILGENALFIEDVSPANLKKLMEEKKADILIAGGRNQYLAVKEGYPFVDINQERHIPYAGYDGLLNFAEQISNSIEYHNRKTKKGREKSPVLSRKIKFIKHAEDVLINPLKHPESIGAAIAFQGIHRAIPVIHGAQGCGFLAKVLLTMHFREPVALANTKLFTEDVVMNGEKNLTAVIEKLIKKDSPDIIGLLTSGLSEMRGDNIEDIIKRNRLRDLGCRIVYVSTPDFEGGLETGYSKAVEQLIKIIKSEVNDEKKKSFFQSSTENQVNVLTGPHHTPADFTGLKEMISSFRLRPVFLPDLSALDGSKKFSSLAAGGTTIDEIRSMQNSKFTIAVGGSMEKAASLLKDEAGIDYKVFDSLSGIEGVDLFMDTLSELSGNIIPSRYERERRILVDGMGDAHFYYGNKKVCIALDPDLAVQTSRWLFEMGANVKLAVVPYHSKTVESIYSEKVAIGDFSSIDGNFDILISNYHGELPAKKLKIPFYQTGFPLNILGSNSRVSTGYRGTLAIINEIGNLLRKGAH